MVLGSATPHFRVSLCHFLGPSVKHFGALLFNNYQHHMQYCFKNTNSRHFCANYCLIGNFVEIRLIYRDFTTKNLKIFAP